MDIFNGDFVQPNRKGAQDSFAEAGPDPASKFELTILIDADQQSAQMLPFAAGLGIATNHE